MTREALVASTALALNEALEACRHAIMADKAGDAADYADATQKLADAFVELDVDE